MKSRRAMTTAETRLMAFRPRFGLAAALDQPGRQGELLAQEVFAAPHLTLIVFVIVTGQMQQAVQDQYLNFHLQGVSMIRCLAAAVSREMARSPPWPGSRPRAMPGTRAHRWACPDPEIEDSMRADVHRPSEERRIRRLDQALLQRKPKTGSGHACRERRPTSSLGQLR